MPFLYDHYTTEWALEADGNKKEAMVSGLPLFSFVIRFDAFKLFHFFLYAD